jgi:hypothetical protein
MRAGIIDKVYIMHELQWYNTWEQQLSDVPECTAEHCMMAGLKHSLSFRVVAERAAHHVEARSARSSVGPGSLRVGLIDELYFLRGKCGVGLLTERIKGRS